MMEIGKTILKFLWKRSGLERLTEAASRKLFRFISVKFSNAPRRWLIILFFGTFLIMSGAFSGSWKGVLVGAVTHFWPPQVDNGTNSISKITNWATVLPDPRTINTNVSLIATNGGWYVVSIKTNSVPSRKERFFAGFARMKQEVGKKSWSDIFWENAWIIGSIIFSLGAACLISLAIVTIVDLVALKVQGEQTAVIQDLQAKLSSAGSTTPSATESAKTLGELLEESGIEAVYGGVPKKETYNQQYAADIVEAVKTARHIKMLTIAGYEFIGRGADSLIYDAIQSNNHHRSIEVILLDPLAGSHIIDGRIEKLHFRDPTYTKDKMKAQIEETCTTLHNLKHRNQKPIRLFLMKCHPVFRLLMTESSVFFSTYTSMHGHEVPVYKVVKTGNPEDTSSWYEAFEQLFENAKSGATEKHV